MCPRQQRVTHREPARMAVLRHPQSTWLFSGTPKALLLLSLLSQVPGQAALCYFHAQAPCLYEGKRFSPGESWQDANCSKCFCLEPLGVGCCDMMHHPVDFPDWCEVHFDTQACQVSLVQKAKPSLPCTNKLKPSWGSGDTTEETTTHLGRHSLQGRR